MNEVLATLLRAVIIAVVPVLVTFFCKAVRAAAQYLGDKSENENAQWYLAEVAEAITNAVTFTSQTYVDALKKSGQFTKENQREALGLAVAQAKNLLTAEATAFLESAYGDLTEYLQSRIEAEVRNQKMGMGTLTLSA